MTIERIDESRIPYWRRTRCEGQVGPATARWRHHSGEDERCKLNALYRLDGVALCQRHAGNVLIERELTR